MDTALRVTEDLVAEFAARKKVASLDEPITAALVSLDQSLMQSSRLPPIVVEGQERE